MSAKCTADLNLCSCTLNVIWRNCNLCSETFGCQLPALVYYMLIVIALLSYKVILKCILIDLIGAREVPSVPCVGRQSAWRTLWGSNSAIPTHRLNFTFSFTPWSHLDFLSTAAKSSLRLLRKSGMCQKIMCAQLLFFAIHCSEILRCSISDIHIWECASSNSTPGCM